MAIPTDIAGLQAWYKADAGTSTTIDGAAISQWDDQSGNARHATQATGGAQPLYKSAILNGLPMVRFDGVDDFLASAGFTLNQPETYLWVGRFIATPASDKMFFDGFAAFTALFALKGSVSTTTLDIYAGTDLLGTGTPLNFHYMSAVFNGASSQLWEDGVSIASGNAGAANAGGITLGAAALGVAPANCDIGEFFVFDSALSTTDRQSMEAYLLDKWFTDHPPGVRPTFNPIPFMR